jgi:hypothetical protein
MAGRSGCLEPRLTSTASHHAHLEQPPEQGAPPPRLLESRLHHRILDCILVSEHHPPHRVDTHQLHLSRRQLAHCPRPFPGRQLRTDGTELQRDQLGQLGLVEGPEPDELIEASPHRDVEMLRAIGRRDEEALTVHVLEQLQHRGCDPPDLAVVTGLAPLLAQHVELIEQHDTRRLLGEPHDGLDVLRGIPEERGRHRCQ